MRFGTTSFAVVASLWSGVALAQSPGGLNGLLRDGTPGAAAPGIAAPTAPAVRETMPGAGGLRPLTKSELRTYGSAATVFVFVKQKKGGALGTGFLIAPDLVMTNAHVVEDAEAIIVVTADRIRRAATLLSITKPLVAGDRDFAVVKLADRVETTPVTFSSTYHALDDIVAFGYPGKVTRTDSQTADMFDANDQRALPAVVVSTGTIQNVIESKLHIEVLTHSAKISQGNSGGPLFDACGRVVGINTFIAEQKLTAVVDKKRATFDIPQGYQWALASREMLIFLKSRDIPVAVDDRQCQ